MKTPFLDKLLHRLDRVGTDDLQNYLQRLAREKGFLETIFNTLQEGILVTDATGKILYLNHSVLALLGLNPAQALGENVARYLKDLNWARIFEERRVVTRDLEITYPEARYLSFYLVPLQGENQESVGFAAIFHDLTEHREKTRAAIESEKLNALTLLAAGVAHELGNPLNSLHIHFQLMERELRRLEEAPRERLQESVQVIKSEIARLDTIINQFLRAVRPTQPERQWASINEIVLESVNFLRPEIKDRDMIVQTDLTEGLPRLEVDAVQLKQAFYNVIKNSLQAMRTGGILKITTDRTDTHLTVSFQDNGAGIDPEDVARIFEPYYTTKKAGSGLGLLIVRRIIREHGGELEMESEPGRGTIFRILLPLTEKRVRLLPPAPEVTDSV